MTLYHVCSVFYILHEICCPVLPLKRRTDLSLLMLQKIEWVTLLLGQKLPKQLYCLGKTNWSLHVDFHANSCKFSCKAIVMAYCDGLTKWTRLMMNWFKLLCSGCHCKHSTNSQIMNVGNSSLDPHLSLPAATLSVLWTGGLFWHISWHLPPVPFFYFIFNLASSAPPGLFPALHNQRHFLSILFIISLLSPLIKKDATWSKPTQIIGLGSILYILRCWGWYVKWIKNVYFRRQGLGLG